MIALLSTLFLLQHAVTTSNHPRSPTAASHRLRGKSGTSITNMGCHHALWTLRGRPLPPAIDHAAWTDVRDVQRRHGGPAGCSFCEACLPLVCARLSCALAPFIRDVKRSDAKPAEWGASGRSHECFTHAARLPPLPPPVPAVHACSPAGPTAAMLPGATSPPGRQPPKSPAAPPTSKNGGQLSSHGSRGGALRKPTGRVAKVACRPE